MVALIEQISDDLPPDGSTLKLLSRVPIVVAEYLAILLGLPGLLLHLLTSEEQILILCQLQLSAKVHGELVSRLTRVLLAAARVV